mgnify:FL=1
MKMKLTYPKMHWQFESKKTRDSSNPEKEDKTLECHSTTLLKEDRNYVIKSVLYPDFRFSCQFCGSLDVMVKMDIFSNPSVTKCLDCGKN